MAIAQHGPSTPNAVEQVEGQNDSGLVRQGEEENQTTSQGMNEAVAPNKNDDQGGDKQEDDWDIEDEIADAEEVINFASLQLEYLEAFQKWEAKHKGRAGAVKQ